MFWTATDVLKIRVSEGRMDEAKKIYMALERLLNSVDDEKGWMHDAMKKCKNLIDRGENRSRLLDNGPEHLQTGIWGEELAASYLREKVYVILERDWHSSHRDIDIIARQGECIVFVEVKTRSNADVIDPYKPSTIRSRGICAVLSTTTSTIARLTVPFASMSSPSSGNVAARSPSSTTSRISRCPADRSCYSLPAM